MLRFVVRRLLSGVVVVLIVSFTLFLLMRSLGNPVVILLGPGNYSKAVAAALAKQLGLTKAWWLQYLQWAAAILQGNLGQSYVLHIPVSQAVGMALPVTLELTGMTMLLSVVLGVPAGVLAAVHVGGWWDNVVQTVSSAAIALPNFFVGVMLVLVFSLVVPVLPASGFVPLGVSVAGNLKYMIMPALTLSLFYIATVARITRGTMLDTLSEAFVRTARSKGASEVRVVLLHGLRSALIPVVTLLGLNIGSLIGGAVVTESIFGLPGMGRLLVSGINQLDLPVVEGVVFVSVIGVVLINILVDIVYAALDPRIRVD